MVYWYMDTLIIYCTPAPSRGDGTSTGDFSIYTLDRFGGPLRVCLPPVEMNDIRKRALVRTLLMLNKRQDPDPSVVEIRTHAGDHPLIETWCFE